MNLSRVLIIIYYIYQIINTINNKSYVGYTKNLAVRKYSHKENAKKLDQILYKAIRKYGWKAFRWEVVYGSTDKEHILEMETFFIKEYNSYCGNKQGYNMTFGGECGGNKGHKQSIDHVSNRINSRKRSNKLNYNCTWLHTPESIAKRAKTRTKSKFNVV